MPLPLVMSGGDVDLQAIPHDGSHLTPDQARTIDAYLIEALDALNLGNWRVYVGKDLPPEHAVLSIFPTDGGRIAILNVTADWWTSRTSDEKRVDITHECLHLAHHDTDEHVRRFFDGSGDISDYVKSLFLEQFKTDLERMVDTLSYSAAALLPPWPDEQPAA